MEFEPMLIPHHKGRKRMHLGKTEYKRDNCRPQSLCLVVLHPKPIVNHVIFFIHMCFRTERGLDQDEHGP